MNSVKENFEVNDSFELLFEACTEETYFVSEIFDDKIVINEAKLNMLNPTLLRELFISI
jgi:hypothetical protein